MSEEQLIEMLKNGDAAALTHLDHLYGNRLRRAALWHCHQTEDADDLLQEIYAAVLCSIHRFQGDCQLFTWLYAILLNIHRHNRKKTRLLFFPGHLPEKAASQTGSAEQYDRNNFYQEIGRVIQTISWRHREVLVLRYFEEMKIDEIARIIDVSPGTVKSRLHFAVRALRKKLGPSIMKIGKPEKTMGE